MKTSLVGETQVVNFKVFVSLWGERSWRKSRNDRKSSVFVADALRRCPRQAEFARLEQELCTFGWGRADVSPAL